VGYKHFDWAYIENKYKSGIDQVVTLMREPVDRAISHFYFHVTKTSGVKDEIRKYKDNLNGYLNNYQLMLETRDLWQDGQASVSWLTGTHIAGWVQCPRNEVPSREKRALDIKDMLLTAAVNLRKTFWFGDLKDLDRSLELLSMQINGPEQTANKITLNQANKVSHDNHKSDSKLDQTIRDKLYRLMPQDNWLYEYSLLLFEARWKFYKEGGKYLEPKLPKFDLEKFYSQCVSTRFVLKCSGSDTSPNEFYTNVGDLVKNLDIPTSLLQNTNINKTSNKINSSSRANNIRKLNFINSEQSDLSSFEKRNVYHLWKYDDNLEEKLELLPF